MLKIENLSVTVLELPILHAVSLAMAPGTTHVIMGPNGSGKSTLAYALMGHPRYAITQGSLTLGDAEFTHMPVHKRAQAGFFLAFQQPLEIPGVSLFSLLKEAYSAHLGKPISVKEFQTVLYEKMALLELEPALAQRAVNEGFSGGEKKRLEILQMLLLNPKVAILDEIDSGLDVDAIKIVARGIQTVRSLNPSLILILITHYPRILQHITADTVHILMNGAIVKSGSSELAHEIERGGYDAFGT